MLTDGAVQQFSGREFQSLGAATEKRRAAVSNCAAELTEASVWMIAASKTDVWANQISEVAWLLERSNQVTKLIYFNTAYDKFLINNHFISI